MTFILVNISVKEGHGSAKEGYDSAVCLCFLTEQATSQVLRIAKIFVCKNSFFAGKGAR